MGRFVLGGGVHPQGGVQASVVVPVDPGHGRELDVAQGPQGLVVEDPGLDALGLEQADDALRQGVEAPMSSNPGEGSFRA